MITKISSNEYLKRLDNMSVAERGEYLERVGEWLGLQAPLLKSRMNDVSARFQDVVQCSVSWNDAECKAWNDGVQLLTAVATKCDTWLPDMLYTKSAKRSIEQLTTCLTQSFGKDNVAKYGGEKEEPAGKSGDTGKKETASSPFRGGTGDGSVNNGHQDSQTKVRPTPVRPKHIDQYVHLLPQKTQEKAGTIRGLLREMDVARENARKLADAGESGGKVAGWAKTAKRLDEKIKAIYKELDAEWEKLVDTGAVRVDDIGNISVDQSALPETDSTSAEPRKPGRPPMTEEEKAAKAAEREAKKKAENQRNAALLRKFLIDKRNARTDIQKDKWIAKYKEMVKLAGQDAVTDKVREAAEYYDIKISEL